MNSEILFVDTDNLSDKLLELKNIIDVDIAGFLADFDSVDFAKYNTLADGSNVGISSKVQKLKNSVTKSKDSLASLVDRSDFFVENLIAFENGNSVSLPDVSIDAKPNTNNNTITIGKGDTLWNLAIEKGYEGSDWQKIFKNPDGSQITSAQARLLDAGDEIIFVGGQEEATVNTGIALSAGALPVIGGLSSLEMLPNLADVDISTPFGTTYYGYGDVASPFPNNPNMVITAPMGYYVVDGVTKRHYGTDWNSLAGDRGEPVSAITSGIVVNVDRHDNGLGYHVQVLSKHEVNGKVEYMLTTYAHLNSASPLVEGQVINEGDNIGNVGRSGLGSNAGEHLHLETEMHLQPKDVKGFSVDDLETYEVEVNNDDGTTSTITMVKTEDLSTRETVSKLFGNDGAFTRSTKAARNFKYDTTEKYNDYVNNNSLSSPNFNNENHAVYETQSLSADSKFEKVGESEQENYKSDGNKVDILVKEMPEGENYGW